MDYLDGWAVTVGSATCSFLTKNGHDMVYRGLCSAGSSPAGWKLFIFSIVIAAAGFVTWRALRPH